jgi:hypothetical protein
MTTPAALADPYWHFVWENYVGGISALDDAPTSQFTLADVVEVAHLARGLDVVPWLAVVRLADGRWVYAANYVPFRGDRRTVRVVARRYVLLWWGALTDDDRGRLEGGAMGQRGLDEEEVVLDELLESADAKVRARAAERMAAVAARRHDRTFRVYNLDAHSYADRAPDPLSRLASFLRGLHVAVAAVQQWATAAYTCRAWPTVAPVALRWDDRTVPGEEHLCTWEKAPTEAQLLAIASALRRGHAVRLFLFGRIGAETWLQSQLVLVPGDR